MTVSAISRTRSVGRRLLAAAVAAASFGAASLAAGEVHAAGGSPAPAAAQPANDALVVIVDGSGSMGRKDVAPNRMSAVRQAAKTVVKSLPSSTRVGLITYGTRTSNKDEARAASCRDILTLSAVRTLSDNHRGSLLDKIDQITPGGWTPIGPSLHRGILSLPDRRGSVLIITDGEDTCAPPDSCEVAKELKRQYPDVTVSTVGLTIGLSDQLACIAAATGGIFVTADDTSELERRLGVVTTSPPSLTLLTPSGYGPAQLGDSRDELASKLEGFPGLDEGEQIAGVWSLRNVTKVTFDSAYYFFDGDGILVGVQPFKPITIDGITVGSTARQVRQTYGDPIQQVGSSALYEASKRTQAGFVVSYDGDAGARDSQAQAIVLCLCVPREVPPTTTTTTTEPSPTTDPSVPAVTVLTAFGYGDAVLGDSLDTLASKIDGFPGWDQSTEHPGMWDLGGLRQIVFDEATYVFNEDRVLVGIQPDQPLTVDGIDLAATARDVASIYGDPIDVRGQQALYEAAVDSAAAYLFTFDGGAGRRSSKVTSIAVCLCGTPTSTTSTTEPSTETSTIPPPPPPPPPTTPSGSTLPPPVDTVPPPAETLPPPVDTLPPPVETLPPVETVPPTEPAAPPVVLRADGIAEVALGTPGPLAVEALTALLGVPSEDSGLPPQPEQDCGGPRTVRWRLGTVDLVISITAPAGTGVGETVPAGEPVEPTNPDGVFTAYELQPPSEPALDPAATLAFDNGLVRGMTWGEWKALLPTSTVETDSDVGIQFGAADDTFFAYFEAVDGVDPTAPPTDDRVIAVIRVGGRACLGV